MMSKIGYQWSTVHRSFCGKYLSTGEGKITHLWFDIFRLCMIYFPQTGIHYICILSVRSYTCLGWHLTTVNKTSPKSRRVAAWRPIMWCAWFPYSSYWQLGGWRQWDLKEVVAKSWWRMTLGAVFCVQTESKIQWETGTKGVLLPFMSCFAPFVDEVHNYVSNGAE